MIMFMYFILNQMIRLEFKTKKRRISVQDSIFKIGIYPKIFPNLPSRYLSSTDQKRSVLIPRLSIPAKIKKDIQIKKHH